LRESLRVEHRSGVAFLQPHRQPNTFPLLVATSILSFTAANAILRCLQVSISNCSASCVYPIHTPAIP
jgi:hypothetical protein